MHSDKFNILKFAITQWFCIRRKHIKGLNMSDDIMFYYSL